MNKTYIPENEPDMQSSVSQIGATMEALAATIASRRDAGEESYTYRLLNGDLDKVLKKVCEEALEVSLAAKETQMLKACSKGGEIVATDAVRPIDNSDSVDACDNSLDTHNGSIEIDKIDKVDASVDHLRYEAADVVYHLLVVLERFGISIDEFAAELNMRMTEEERPVGSIRLQEEHIRRGK